MQILRLLATQLAGGFNPALGLFAPNYRSPRSLQMNVGFQREIRHGMMISADYVRNVETHGLLGVDVNHAGSTRYFNRNGALNAISTTNNNFGCGTGTDSASIDCAISGMNNIQMINGVLTPVGATIGDYAGNGLGTPNDFGSSVPKSGMRLWWHQPDLRPDAFPGADQPVGLQRSTNEVRGQ